jgi:hypothetical protein
LASRSRANSSHGLCFPTALGESKIHFTRALPARYGPPAGFGYPLGGLRPSIPCRFYFAPAALLGFALRSLLLPQGTDGVSAAVDPRAVSPVVLPTADAAGRPDRPRLLGFHPCRSPLPVSALLTRWPPDAPLGFALLGPANAGLGRLTPTASHALGRPPCGNPHAPQSVKGSRLVRCQLRTSRGHADSPYRVLAPVRSRTFERLPAWPMCSAHAAPCIAAGWPAI